VYIYNSQSGAQQEIDTIEAGDSREQPMFNNPIDQGVRERETTMQPSGIDMRSSKLTLIDRKRLLHSAKKTNETPLVAVEETERARPTAPRFKRDRETVYGTRGDIQSPTSTLLDRKRMLYDPKMNMASQFSSEEEERTRRKSLRLKDASTNLPINQRRKPKSRRLGKTWTYRNCVQHGKERALE
jgi:hypothetical protein